jgi:hypothetical protein
LPSTSSGSTRQAQAALDKLRQHSTNLKPKPQFSVLKAKLAREKDKTNQIPQSPNPRIDGEKLFSS